MHSPFSQRAGSNLRLRTIVTGSPLINGLPSPKQFRANGMLKNQSIYQPFRSFSEQTLRMLQNSELMNYEFYFGSEQRQRGSLPSAQMITSNNQNVCHSVVLADARSPATISLESEDIWRASAVWKAPRLIKSLIQSWIQPRSIQSLQSADIVI